MYKESFELPAMTLFPDTYHMASVLLLGQYLSQRLIKVLLLIFQNKLRAHSLSSVHHSLLFFLRYLLYHLRHLVIFVYS